MRIENNYSPLQISGKIIVELRRVRSQLDGGPGLMNHRRGQDRNVRERQGEGVGACAWILFFLSFFLSEDYHSIHGTGLMEITERSEKIERSDRWRLLSSCLALVLSQV